MITTHTEVEVELHGILFPMRVSSVTPASRDQPEEGGEVESNGPAVWEDPGAYVGWLCQSSMSVHKRWRVWPLECPKPGDELDRIEDLMLRAFLNVQLQEMALELCDE